MATPARRREMPHDPLRERFVEARRAFFRLHKTLIDAERAAFERRQGSLSGGQFLQALLQDPALEWLRPFSALIVEIDETLAAREPLEPAEVGTYVARMRTLLAAGEADGEDGVSGRYETLRDRDPDVLVAHVELVRRIAELRPDPDAG
jgi:hypothetical protein